MSEEPDWQAALAVLRIKIDAVDNEIMRLLGERGKLVHQVGELKPHVGAVRDPKRESQVLERAARLSAENGLEAEFGRDLYRFLLNYFATREEVQVMRRDAR